MTTRDDLVSLARNFIDNQDAGIGDAWALIEELADAIEANGAEIAMLTADRNQMMKQVAELRRQLAAETERCARICDQIRNNAERRAADHKNDEARNSALDKMVGAIECAAAIRGGAK